MPKFLKKNKKTESKQKHNNGTQNNTPALTKIRRRIAWQASLAVLTIVLTLVIAFAMTSAWYTNIVQTNGLTFDVEAWGFDGEIITNTDAVLASPGEDGVIHLEVENNNENVASINVNISKLRMDDEMQKRLYFYADTQQIRNGETVERIYFNSRESYTYTLFSNGKLTLTETVHNDAQLKWHWVYDVLGYYVLGTANADGTDVDIIEYLRPIEYDYDEATTTFVKETVTVDGVASELLTMVLDTVDGETSVEEFLVNLSKTDGYEGTIEPTKKMEAGYYPVDVDEEGYGVYAYLCNYSEIEFATQYDTTLGEKAAAAEAGVEGTEPVRYEAKLTISVQKDKSNTLNVTSLAALNTAMGLDADIIQLSSDITIAEDQNIVIASGQRVMVDLNGHTIVNETAKPTIEVEEGGSLTLVNTADTGGLVSTVAGSQAIYAVGAEVTLNKIAIKDFTKGIYVMDSESDQAIDSKVRLIGCSLDTSGVALMVRGNGSASVQKSQVILENCTVSSDGIAISGNGSTSGNGTWGTDIQLIGSTVISDENNLGAGIYHPQKDSTLTIYDSTVSGYTAVALKGGMVSVTAGSRIKGLGATANAPSAGDSGFADTADAVYIETNYGYPIDLEISGDSVLTSTNGRSLQVYEADAPHVTVTIYSGSFGEAQPESYIAEGSVQEGSVVRVSTETPAA